MINSSRALLAFLLLITSADAFWRMSCGIIQTGRVDPIIAPGNVAGHTHKISGASNFGMSSTFDSLQASRCTSCEIQDDKSAYWTPQLFYQHANGTFQMVPNGGTVVYYLGRGENRQNTEPFPPGFKVLSGDSTARSNDTTKMTYSTKGYAGRPVSDRVSFACLDSSGPSKEQNYMWRTDCDNGMRAQIQFPSCWNGGDYQSDQSHVAYMSQIDNGICPPTHPRQLPHLFFEVIYGVNDIVKTKGGQFVFANGDTTGFSFHGDFMNGWKTDVLTAAIKQCLNNDSLNGEISKCPPLAASTTPFFSTNCPERPPIVNETVRGIVDKLPGCNPVTKGPGRAPQQICATQPPLNKIIPDTGAAAVEPSVGDKVGTWAYVGCAAELSNSRSLSKYSVSSKNMTIDYCASVCKDQGYPLAGLENSNECWCSDALAKGASYLTAKNCVATPKMICPGNSSQFCGAPSMLTVWSDTSYVAPAPLIVGKTQIASGAATYYGCYAEPSNGRALSSDNTVASGMTNEVCAQYCKAGGYTYAGTEYSSECYCSNTLGGTNITDITQCSMKCSGDKLSYCGGGSKLSVWQIAQPPKSNTPVTALDGDATYVGCYTDGGSGGRTLPGPSFSGSTVSVETCAAFCKKANYPLFGMEYGSECYCGYATKTQATQVNDGECKMKCAGNATQKCGAGSRLSVWTNELYTPTRNPSTVKSDSGQSYQYVGCYTEGSGGRALSAASTADGSKMTVEFCATFCSGKGYAFFGVEYGQECYCNNDGPGKGSAQVSDTDCSMTCKGDASEWCGAGNRLNVYKQSVAARPNIKVLVQPKDSAAANAKMLKVASTTKKAAAKPTTTSKKPTTTKKAAAKPTTTSKKPTTTNKAAAAKKTTSTKKATTTAVAPANMKLAQAKATTTRKATTSKKVAVSSTAPARKLNFKIAKVSTTAKPVKTTTSKKSSSSSTVPAANYKAQAAQAAKATPTSKVTTTTKSSTSTTSKKTSTTSAKSSTTTSKPTSVTTSKTTTTSTSSSSTTTPTPLVKSPSTTPSSSTTSSTTSKSSSSTMSPSQTPSPPVLNALSMSSTSSTPSISSTSSTTRLTTTTPPPPPPSAHTFSTSSTSSNATFTTSSTTSTTSSVVFRGVSYEW